MGNFKTGLDAIMGNREEFASVGEQLVAGSAVPFELPDGQTGKAALRIVERTAGSGWIAMYGLARYDGGRVVGERHEQHASQTTGHRHAMDYCQAWAQNRSGLFIATEADSVDSLQIHHLTPPHGEAMGNLAIRVFVETHPRLDPFDTRAGQQSLELAARMQGDGHWFEDAALNHALAAHIGGMPAGV